MELGRPPRIGVNTIDDLVFKMTGGEDAAVFSSPSVGVNQFDAATTLATHFANPNSSVTINASGTDSVELNSVATGFNANLMIAGDSDDSVAITGNAVLLIWGLRYKRSVSLPAGRCQQLVASRCRPIRYRRPTPVSTSVLVTS